MPDQLCDQKIYRVGTFWHEPRDGDRRGIATGYLRGYNPEWKGCIIYEVAAPNGREAVRIASKMRAEREAGNDA